VIKAKRSIY